MNLIITIKNGIVAIYEKIVNALVVICCALIVLMMLSVSASVLLRRSQFDFGWALEVSEYILIIITLFGSGWLLRTGGHVRVDIVGTYMHGKQKNLYNTIIFSIVSLVCLVFTIIGIQAVIDAYMTGTIEYKVYFEFKKWIVLSLFPVAGFIMWIESSKSAVAYFRKTFS